MTYTSDSALDGAINRVRHNTTGPDAIGRDPQRYPADACNPANKKVVYRQDETGTTPAVVVSCQVEAGGGSGVPADLGSVPPFALLTLGDPRSDGSIGVRNEEPGPYNAGSFDLCAPDRQEFGIRFNTAVAPFACSLGVVTAPWQVRGDIFSNSKIRVDPSGSNPQPAPGSTIRARGGCSGSTILGCTDVGWNFADGLGRDPAVGDPAAYAPAPIDDLSVQSVPPTSACVGVSPVVEFPPGIYTDAAALNALFAEPNCRNATFWFKPGTDAGTGDAKTGVFYFDFRNAPPSATYRCGPDLYGAPTNDQGHAWCVGGRGADYGGQRVVGGTPLGWSPNANPTTHQVVLEPAGTAGNGPLGGLLQKSQFATTANAKAIEATPADPLTADLFMEPGKPGGSIWLSGYPKVPRGGYEGLDLEIAHAGINVSRMNAPTVQVSYGPLGLGGNCGTYTLPKPPTDGSVATIKLLGSQPRRCRDAQQLSQHRRPHQYCCHSVQRESPLVPDG